MSWGSYFQFDHDRQNFQDFSFNQTFCYLHFILGKECQSLFKSKQLISGGNLKCRHLHLCPHLPEQKYPIVVIERCPQREGRYMATIEDTKQVQTQRHDGRHTVLIKGTQPLWQKLVSGDQSVISCCGTPSRSCWL